MLLMLRALTGLLSLSSPLSSLLWFATRCTEARVLKNEPHLSAKAARGAAARRGDDEEEEESHRRPIDCVGRLAARARASIPWASGIVTVFADWPGVASEGANDKQMPAQRKSMRKQAHRRAHQLDNTAGVPRSLLNSSPTAAMLVLRRWVAGCVSENRRSEKRHAQSKGYESRRHAATSTTSYCNSWLPG
jgi:hypothetical protein